jgi:hypothetical protein
VGVCWFWLATVLLINHHGTCTGTRMDTHLRHAERWVHKLLLQDPLRPTSLGVSSAEARPTAEQSKANLRARWQRALVSGVGIDAPLCSLVSACAKTHTAQWCRRKGKNKDMALLLSLIASLAHSSASRFNVQIDAAARTASKQPSRSPRGSIVAVLDPSLRRQLAAEGVAVVRMPSSPRSPVPAPVPTTRIDVEGAVRAVKRERSSSASSSPPAQRLRLDEVEKGRSAEASASELEEACNALIQSLSTLWRAWSQARTEAAETLRCCGALSSQAAHVTAEASAELQRLRRERSLLQSGGSRSEAPAASHASSSSPDPPILAPESHRLHTVSLEMESCKREVAWARSVERLLQCVRQQFESESHKRDVALWTVCTEETGEALSLSVATLATRFLLDRSPALASALERVLRSCSTSVPFFARAAVWRHVKGAFSIHDEDTMAQALGSSLVEHQGVADALSALEQSVETCPPSGSSDVYHVGEVTVLGRQSSASSLDTANSLPWSDGGGLADSDHSIVISISDDSDDDVACAITLEPSEDPSIVMLDQDDEPMLASGDAVDMLNEAETARANDPSCCVS